jgi:hypothetical protein
MDFGKRRIVKCRRRFIREPVMLAGSAMSITRSRSVMISDVSREGAGLGGRDLPTAGDDLVMKAGSVDRMATVVWRAGDRCGFQLDRPLQDENIERMKAEAAWDLVFGWVS